MNELSTNYHSYDLATIEDETGRRYITPSGKLYPSVTTAIGRYFGEKEFLKHWRAAVGDEYANTVSRIAKERGSELHELAERYLRGDKNCDKTALPDAAKLFRTIRQNLEDVDRVFLLESCLWSDRYKIAGRVDAAGRYKGLKSIIDFKTSKQFTTAIEIKEYFYQVACYAFMFEEMYGEKIEKGVIIIATPFGRSQVFEFDPEALRDHKFFKNLETA